MPPLSQFPFPFWAACFVAFGSGVWFWKQRRLGFGIPALAVLGTIAVWYFGDALYNDYLGMNFKFGEETLSAAWWEVCLFLGAFALLVPQVHRSMNHGLKQQDSEVLRFATKREIENPVFQRAIDRFLTALLSAWVVLMITALMRVNFDFKGLFLPWLGHKAEPWGRDRIGGGLDAILSLSAYVQVFLTAAFGIVAGISRNPRTRFIALLICAIAIPYYLFDRTRNTMIATMLPGVLAWVFIGLRGNIIVRLAILAAAFLALESWLAFVMKARGEGKNVAVAFAQEGAQDEESEEEEDYDIKAKTKHEGLNMFEELAWINSFIESGNYKPNGGQRYFAELVNPIPRSLWPGKPLIGIDYAKARGFSGGGTAGAGVVASVSTGMIGQGITNFGRFFGPLAAALIMAGWVALLARQDLSARGEPGRLLLYGLGLVLTFNLGRDITLLVLYPFLFGLLLFQVWKRYFRKPALSARVSPSGIKMAADATLPSPPLVSRTEGSLTPPPRSGIPILHETLHPSTETTATPRGTSAPPTNSPRPAHSTPPTTISSSPAPGEALSPLPDQPQPAANVKTPPANEGPAVAGKRTFHSLRLTPPPPLSPTPPGTTPPEEKSLE